MTFENFIVEKMSTFPDKTIHIAPRCDVHLHGHRNKMVPLMKPSTLADLNKALSFTIAPISRIMTFKAIVSRTRLITTTSITRA
jgi:hypothetical protein